MAQQAGHVLVVCNVINSIFSLYDYLYNNSTRSYRGGGVWEGKRFNDFVNISEDVEY